jgi:fumarate reductase flavoprotein subunit
MQSIDVDVVIVGAGGAGLRAAIAVAEKDASLQVALISKVYPMRSHTVAAEGGSAGAVLPEDSLEHHFNDTVSGGDWLCDQDAVEYFVAHCTEEMVQLEHWGCPWSRRPNGRANVRAFGGMKIERTWFAADLTGFHMLHTLFQTSMKFPSIRRLDEYFVCDLLAEDGHARGVLAIEVATGEFAMVRAGAVVIATGGAGRVYRQNTNGGIVTGDGMALAYRRGVPLRDMEFVQYHPTCMPGTGLLFTEACRGEGGILTNKDGYRYLQDYGLGPADPWPRKKAMELGPRDRISQAFWHEEKKGRTVATPHGAAVNLDLRHLGHAHLRERLPQICELAERFLGIDPAKTPIPVRPAVHYTMGGIPTDKRTATPMPGLFAVGECASSGIHGANRLGSNSLAELCVFGKVAGEEAARFAREHAKADSGNGVAVRSQAQEAKDRALEPLARRGTEKLASIRDAMGRTMEEHCGIYRDTAGLEEACRTLAELKARVPRVELQHRARGWNTEWLTLLELSFQVDVAEAMAHSALARRESRGAHQRLDEGATERDDLHYLKHTLAWREAGAPRIGWSEVVITRSPPATRAYGAAGEAAEKTPEMAPLPKAVNA